MSNIEDRIKTVAIYLRKSRANNEEEEDIASHREKLVGIAEDYGWDYEIFSEVGSGSSLDDREKMVQLLGDIEKNLFDAVLIMDIDRLSRNDGADKERIYYTLSATDTLIVTGGSFQVYDMSKEGDVDMINMRTFFSSFESRKIKSRFRQGKIAGARRGDFVYGSVPFGYEYNKDTKRLRVKPEEGETVRRAVELFMEGKSTGEIAWNLNKEKVLSQTGALWSNKMINRMLQKDVYLGNTIYNKSQGTPLRNNKSKYGSTPYKKNPESEWKTIYNTHEALITKEERKEIDKHYADWGRRRAKITPDGSVFDLSGLVESPNGLRYTRRIESKNKTESLIIMKDHRVDESLYPKHLRVDPELVRHAIMQSIGVMEKQVADNLKKNSNQEELVSYQKVLGKLDERYQVVLDAQERISIGFIEGLYSMDMSQKLREDKEREQADLEKEIRDVKKKIDTFSNSKNLDRLDRIRNFKRDIEKAGSNKEINLLYKSIISKIVAERKSLIDVDITVSFL